MDGQPQTQLDCLVGLRQIRNLFHFITGFQIKGKMERQGGEGVGAFGETVSERISVNHRS